MEFLGGIAGNEAKAEFLLPEVVGSMLRENKAKVKELLESANIDEQRIITETAIFADKVAVNEEMVRLSSHFEEFFSITASDQPAGRKLDFLIQEINREVNTIGSKANDLFITKTVVTSTSDKPIFLYLSNNIQLKSTAFFKKSFILTTFLSKIIFHLYNS